MPHITTLMPYSSGKYMLIDSSSRRNLELVETMREKQKRGSLLWVLDKTKTAMRARMLRSYIAVSYTHLSTRFLLKSKNIILQIYSMRIICMTIFSLSQLNSLQMQEWIFSCTDIHSMITKAVLFTGIRLI